MRQWLLDGLFYVQQRRLGRYLCEYHIQVPQSKLKLSALCSHFPVSLYYGAFWRLTTEFWDFCLVRWVSLDGSFAWHGMTWVPSTLAIFGLSTLESV